MAIGAGWAGARALTATSGPGISLMSEFVGMAYFAEIPVVIIDVQRMGPSTGLPTRTSQGDILKLHLLGHGDSRHIVLIPGSVEECYSLTIEALDLAQQFQTPVFVATDLDLGMNLWLSEPFPYPTKPIQRGKVLNADDLERLGQFERYKDVDGDGVCYRTIPGTEHPLAAYFTRGTGHNEKSGYSERPEDWKKNLDRLVRKLETARGGPAAAGHRGRARHQGRADRLRRHALGDGRGPRPAPRRRDPHRVLPHPRLARLRRGPAFHRAAPAGLRDRAKPRRPGHVDLEVDLERGAGRSAVPDHALQRHADRRREHRPAHPRLGEEPLRPRLAHRQRRARQSAGSPRRARLARITASSPASQSAPNREPRDFHRLYRFHEAMKPWPAKR